MSNNTLEALVKPGYKERLTLEIDRRDPDLMTIIVVSRTVLAHSIDVVDLADSTKQQKQPQHRAPDSGPGPAPASSGKRGGNDKDKGNGISKDKQDTQSDSTAVIEDPSSVQNMNANENADSSIPSSSNARSLAQIISRRYEYAHEKTEADTAPSAHRWSEPCARHAALKPLRSSIPGWRVSENANGCESSAARTASAPATPEKGNTCKRKRPSKKRARKSNGYYDYPEEFDSETETETEPASSEPKPVKWRQWV